MKCSQALETMLEAEPADLSPDGLSALAVHLRSCAKCARVAATMRADVRALASVMPSTPAATRFPWPLWRGISLASAAVALMVVMTHEPSVPTAPTLRADMTPGVVAPRAVTVQEPAPSPSARMQTGIRGAESARYAMPDPTQLGGPADADDEVLPVSASEPAFDGVSASSSGRVTVLKTLNPKITVIWFN